MSINRFDKFKNATPTEAELAAPKFQQDFAQPLALRVLAYHRWRLILIVLALGCFVHYAYWEHRADVHRQSDYQNLDESFNHYADSPFNWDFVGMCGVFALICAGSPLGMRFAVSTSPLRTPVMLYWGAAMAYGVFRLTSKLIAFDAPDAIKFAFYPYVLVALGLIGWEIRALSEEVGA